MAIKIDTLWKAPVKGALGYRHTQITVDPIVGVQQDRQYAIRRTPGDMKVWAPKAAFYVCMNTSQMATESPAFQHRNVESGKLDPKYLWVLHIDSKQRQFWRSSTLAINTASTTPKVPTFLFSIWQV
jgi:uncharacterized protein YcbX